MVSSVQTKLRQAIGAFKDRASISFAKVSSSRLPDLEIAIVKSTSHHEFPCDEKHFQEILYLTSCSREHIDTLVSCVTRRLSRTSNWIVALKALLLCHRLLQFGDPSIEHEFSVSRRRGMRLFNVFDFYDGSHPHGWEFSAFVRAYGVYLDERFDCPIPSLSSLQNSAKKYPSNGNCLSPDRKRSSVVESQKARHRRKPVRKMKPYELIEKFPAFLRLIKRMICCRPSGVAKFHKLVLSAMHHILTESFLLYKDVHDGMAILLDGFFDMEQCECDTAFEVYCSAAKQVDELICFYNFCKTLPVVGKMEYPCVENVSRELLQTMQASLKLRLASSQLNSKKIDDKNAHVRSVSFQDEAEVMSSTKIHENGCVPGPLVSIAAEAAAAAEEEESVSRRPSVLKSSVSSKDVAPMLTMTANGDGTLSDTSKTVTPSSEEVTLSLFSGPKAETKISVNWETFSPVETRPLILCQGQTSGANNNATSGWESALIETETSASRPVTGSMAGGFDQLLLDCTPYDHSKEQQQSVAEETGMVVFTDRTPSRNGTNSSQLHTEDVLALPAPPPAVAVRPETTDPFAAAVSLGVPPLPYVQMLELNQKHRLLVAEQQQWLQFQPPATLRGYNTTMNFSHNPFISPFLSQTTIQPIHCYGSDSYYHGSFSPYSTRSK